MSRMKKLRRRVLHFRYRPIRVFCFHQVSDEFEPDTMKKCDWMQTDAFKQGILALKKQYTLISLPEVTRHLTKDRFRLKQYAALTFDDGWASLKNVLPWLDKQQVPVTLFLNPCYMDGKHYREKDTEKYLTKEEIAHFTARFKNLTVASHGWEHKTVSSLSDAEFRDDIEKSRQVLKDYSCSVAPYYAYPWGKHSSITDSILREYGLVPVLMDGMKNYSDPYVIHRELLTE